MKFKIKRINYPIISIIFIGFLLISYTMLRAVLLSMTHDESFTFLWFVPESFMQIVSMHIPRAGNHIINTLAIKLFTSIFSANEFIVRLPNLLAHFVYIVFSILIIKRVKTPLLIIVGFILLNFNPYMLEFFALARGYGISLAFLIGSIYFFIKFLDEKKQKFIYYALVSAALSAISSFIYIHFYLSIILIYNLVQINDFRFIKSVNERFKFLLRINIPVIIVTAILSGILFEPIRKLSKFKEFYGHGQTGFYHNSIISLIHGSKYNQDYGTVTAEMISYVVIILVAIILLVAFIDLYRKKFDLQKSLPFIFVSLLLLPVLTIILQHHLLGSEFPSFRLMLFFVPLLGLTFIGASTLFEKPPLRFFSTSIITLMAILFVIHTARSVNLKSASEWKYDADTKQMVEILKSEVLKNDPTNKVSLGINWVFEPTINFYRVTKKYNWLQQVTRDGISGEYNYYYIFKENLAEFSKVEIIKEFETSNTVLLRKVVD